MGVKSASNSSRTGGDSVRGGRLDERRRFFGGRLSSVLGISSSCRARMTLSLIERSLAKRFCNRRSSVATILSAVGSAMPDSKIVCR